METLQNRKTPSRTTFGLFEADLKSGELWKAGHRVKLQALPFKVLTILLENTGEVVSREELQKRVWGPDIIVDFEHSLSNAIKKLREALGDSADNPRFIETLSRRGVRFIAPVGVVEETSTTNIGVPAITRRVPTPSESQPEKVSPDSIAPAAPHRARHLIPALCLGLGVLLAVCSLQFLNSRKPGAEPPRLSRVTQDGMVYVSKDHLLGALSAFATDGTHLFTPVTENGEIVLSRMSESSGTGQTIPLLSQIGAPEV